MGQINQKWDRLLTFIFEYPEESFTVREAAKASGIPSSTIQRYLQRLQQEGILTKENSLVKSSYVKFKKAFHLINKIFTSGLISYLEEKLTPSVIVIFGSVRKGEYIDESDIDIFIESTRTGKLNLHPFERKLGHHIQTFLHKDIRELPTPLFHNVLNGIKVSGYLKVK